MDEIKGRWVARVLEHPFSDQQITYPVLILTYVTPNGRPLGHVFANPLGEGFQTLLFNPPTYWPPPNPKEVRNWVRGYGWTPPPFLDEVWEDMSLVRDAFLKASVENSVLYLRFAEIRRKWLALTY